MWKMCLSEFSRFKNERKYIFIGKHQVFSQHALYCKQQNILQVNHKLLLNNSLAGLKLMLCIFSWEQTLFEHYRYGWNLNDTACSPVYIKVPADNAYLRNIFSWMHYKYHVVKEFYFQPFLLLSLYCFSLVLFGIW